MKNHCHKIFQVNIHEHKIQKAKKHDSVQNYFVSLSMLDDLLDSCQKFVETSAATVRHHLEITLPSKFVMHVPAQIIPGNL